MYSVYRIGTKIENKNTFLSETCFLRLLSCTTSPTVSVALGERRIRGPHLTVTDCYVHNYRTYITALIKAPLYTDCVGTFFRSPILTLSVPCSPFPPCQHRHRRLCRRPCLFPNAASACLPQAAESTAPRRSRWTLGCPGCSMTGCSTAGSPALSGCGLLWCPSDSTHRQENIEF